jgi:hypothetical protein
MHNLLDSCRHTVGKLWQVRTLSPYLAMYITTVWVNRGLCTRVMRRFTTSFSTSISYHLSLFNFYLYPLSTPPTKTTTSFLNFKSLVIVKELA